MWLICFQYFSLIIIILIGEIAAGTLAYVYRKEVCLVFFLNNQMIDFLLFEKPFEVIIKCNVFFFSN